MKSFLAKALLVVGSILSGIFGLHKDVAKNISPSSQTASVISSETVKSPKSSSDVGIGTTSPNQTTTTPKQSNPNISKTEVESIVNSKITSLINSGKLRGPKGDKGDKGDAGEKGQNGQSGISTSYTTPSGYTLSAQNLTVAYTPPGASNPGSVGGITYFSSKEHTTGKQTVTDTATINTLGVTGTSSLASLLVSSLLPQAVGSVTDGVVTNTIITGLHNFYNDMQKFIALGPDGYVRFLYWNNGEADLHFVVCTSDDCTTKTDTLVATAVPNTMDSNTIVMGTDGFARITYTDDYTYLHLIVCANTDCSTKTDSLVDTSLSPGNYYEVGLALDSSNKARIVYNDFTNSPEELQLAVCADTSCSSFATSTVTTIGLSSSTDVGIQIASDG